MNNYQNIDMCKTGKNIESMIKNAGYNVKTIQKYLQLSCPQPIYRWYKGQILPTVDHLFMLSKLLHVHMEELIVQKQDKIECLIFENESKSREQRMILYCNRLREKLCA